MHRPSFVLMNTELHSGFYDFIERQWGSRHEPRPALPRHQDRAWLEREYVALGKSPAKLAKSAGVSRVTIAAWLRKFGFPARTEAFRGLIELGKNNRFEIGGYSPHHTPQPYWDRHWLSREYVEQKRSVQEIATQFGVAPNAVGYWVQKFDLPRQDRDLSAFLEGGKVTRFKAGSTVKKHQPYWEADWLRREFIDQCRTVNEIAAQFGVNKSVINRWLRHHNIPRPDYRYRSGTKTCRLCNELFPLSAFRLRTKRKDGVIVHRYPSNRCKECERHIPRGISGGAAKKLLAAQKDRCWWCGGKLNSGYEVDHRFAVARGGPNHPSNLVLSCRPCNRKKGTKTPWEFAGRLL